MWTSPSNMCLSTIWSKVSVARRVQKSPTRSFGFRRTPLTCCDLGKRDNRVSNDLKTPGLRHKMGLKSSRDSSRANNARGMT